MRRREALRLVLVAALAWLPIGPSAATTADTRDHKTAGGLSVYLGVLPAAMIRGHPKDHPEQAMHRGVPRGPHAFHIMAAVFDAASGDRIEDANVEASVASIGDAAAHIAGQTRRLQPMVIADAVTYGNYFTLRGDGPYRIVFTITWTGAPEPVRLEFVHDHRTR
jgi:hypothetical protein